MFVGDKSSHMVRCDCCGNFKRLPRHTDIGRMIRSARETRNISRTVLARRLGTNTQSVKNYEDGTSGIKWATLCQIAQALGYSLRVKMQAPSDL